MRNKVLYLGIEIVGLNLISLFLVWRLYMKPGMINGNINIVHQGLIIFSIIFVAIMIVISFQVYKLIIEPNNKKINELEQVAKKNAEAEKIRRDFVANVTHEIKTPLTSIAGFIETLQNGAAEDPEIRKRFLQIIDIETARLKRLIEDLLILSDIENKKNFVSEKFRPADMLIRTIDVLKPIAESKRVKIVTDLNETVMLEGSADRFNQMMLNLIENAIKYSKEGGYIWIDEKIFDNKLEIRIKDEGIGIAEKDQDRLFERFYRVDKSRSRKVGGTGLGLSIVKHIVALFEAEINVKSSEGRGTTFVVTFNM